ncbi:MAG: IS110 family transposase [Desulfobacteraceae bacterium]|jgi:transposase|nr:IS110 family transposase [Desulfobacteraceae bacterium]
MKSSKPEKVRNINEKTLICSLDIGKGAHQAYFKAPNGRDIKPFGVHNFRKSFGKFWMRLSQFKREHKLEEVVIGFESTGPYAEPLFHYLRKKPVKLVQINPMHSKRLKELTGNSPNKTDRKDPRVIADVISLGHALTLVVPEGPAADLRRLTQARERAIKRRTAALNQLQDLIFVIFPEFLSIMKGISTKTAFHLIKKYPTPQSIVALGVESLTMLVRKVSRGRFGQQRAEELFNGAKSSIGIQEGKRSILLEIEYLVSQIGADNRFIANLEEQMENHLKKIPYSHSILSIKGIGIITVAGLIGEVGDFKKFHTIPEIMKLAGLDLYEVSSGKHRGQRRISKRGRPLMRKLLFFAAINVVKSNGIMHERYQQMLQRGMPKVKALIAISRKVLKLIFAIARDNTVYIENYGNKQHLKLAA